MRILARPGTDVGEVNPYTRLLYGHVRRMGYAVDDFSFWRAFFGRYDVFHMHWPEYFIAHPNTVKAYAGSLGTLLAMRWMASRGTKIVWTIHNLKSHHGPRPRVERLFWRAFVRRVDAFIAMSESGRVEAEQEYPRLRGLRQSVIPHGHYRGAYPNVVSRADARDSVGVPQQAPVIAFLGNIAPYKGVAELAAAFRKMPDTHLRLVIAGASDDAKEAAVLQKRAEQDSRLILHLGFIPAERIQAYLNAADLVVLPFRKIWNSGSAMLALSFDRPILVPAHGAFVELKSAVGAGWVRTYEGQIDAALLGEALEWATAAERGLQAPLERFEWSTIAEETVNAYVELVKSSGDELIVPAGARAQQRARATRTEL